MNKCTNQLPNGQTCNSDDIHVMYENNTVKVKCMCCKKVMYANTPAEARIQWNLANPEPVEELKKVKSTFKPHRPTIFDRVKKHDVVFALTQENGVKTRTAKNLGISTSSLRKLMKAYGLK